MLSTAVVQENIYCLTVIDFVPPKRKIQIEEDNFSPSSKGLEPSSASYARYVQLCSNDFHSLRNHCFEKKIFNTFHENSNFLHIEVAFLWLILGG